MELKVALGQEVSTIEMTRKSQMIYVSYKDIIMLLLFTEVLFIKIANSRIAIFNVDISFFSAVAFFGCSEARHKQDYGCDEDDQTLDVLDKFKKKVQVIKFLFA